MDAKKTATWGEVLLGEGREKRRSPEGLARLLYLPRSEEESLDPVRDGRPGAGCILPSGEIRTLWEGLEDDPRHSSSLPAGIQLCAPCDTGFPPGTCGNDAEVPLEGPIPARSQCIKTGVIATAIFLMTAMVLLPSSIAGSGYRGHVHVKPHRVTVTAYTNVEACTDSTPNETASLLKIKPRHYGKIIALSRDLAEKYEFGDQFELQLNGKTHVVEYQDLMARRFRNRIDLLLPSVKKSLRFGVNEGVLIPMQKGGKQPARRMG